MDAKLPPLTDDWKMNYANLLHHHRQKIAHYQSMLDVEKDQNAMLHRLIETHDRNEQVRNILESSQDKQKCTIL